MTWKRCLLLITVSIAQSQNLQVPWRPNNGNLFSQHAALSEFTTDKDGYSKKQSSSYDPESVCFNPQHYDNFANHMMNRSPIPRPNYYGVELTANDLSTKELACPRDTERLPTKRKRFRPNSFNSPHEPSMPSPWNSPFSYRNQIVPLIYFPSVTKNGRVDFRAVEYLKRLKNALNENPLLSKNRTSGKHTGIKIDGLPNSRERPSTKFDGKTAFPRPYSDEITISGRRVTRHQEEKEKNFYDLYMKGEKMRADRPKNDHNFRTANKYPLPKFVYVNGKSAPPSTYFDRRKFFTDFAATII